VKAIDEEIEGYGSLRQKLPEMKDGIFIGPQI
jgi:hypothetical protein